MVSERHRLAAERFRIAMALYDAGEAMLRQKIRRKSPQATDQEIQAQVVEWRRRRPGAEHGDAEGRPIPWPRHR